MPPALKQDLTPYSVLSTFIEDFSSEVPEYSFSLCFISVSKLLSHTGRPQEVFERELSQKKPKIAIFELVWDVEVTMENVTKVIKCVPGNLQSSGFMEVAGIICCTGCYYTSVCKVNDVWKFYDKFVDKDPVSWVKIAWFLVSGNRYPSLIAYHRVDGYKSTANFITSLDYENLIKFSKKQDLMIKQRPRNSERRGEEAKQLEKPPLKPTGKSGSDIRDLRDLRERDRGEVDENADRKSFTPINRKYDLPDFKQELGKRPDSRGSMKKSEQVSPRNREESFRSWDKDAGEMERIYLGTPKEGQPVRSFSRQEESIPKLNYTPSRPADKFSHFSPKDLDKQNHSPYFRSQTNPIAERNGGMEGKFELRKEERPDSVKGYEFKRDELRQGYNIREEIEERGDRGDRGDRLERGERGEGINRDDLQSFEAKRSIIDSAQKEKFRPSFENFSREDLAPRKDPDESFNKNGRNFESLLEKYKDPNRNQKEDRDSWKADLDAKWKDEQPKWKESDGNRFKGLDEDKGGDRQFAAYGFEERTGLAGIRGKYEELSRTNEKSENTEWADRGSRAEWLNKRDWMEKGEKLDRDEWGSRGERDDRVERVERGERLERGEKIEFGNRGDREERADRFENFTDSAKGRPDSESFQRRFLQQENSRDDKTEERYKFKPEPSFSSDPSPKLPEAPSYKYRNPEIESLLNRPEQYDRFRMKSDDLEKIKPKEELERPRFKYEDLGQVSPKPSDYNQFRSKPEELETFKSKPEDFERLRTKPEDFERLRTKPEDFERLRSKPEEFERLKSKPEDFERFKPKAEDFERFKPKTEDFERFKPKTEDFDRYKQKPEDFERFKSRNQEDSENLKLKPDDLDRFRNEETENFRGKFDNLEKFRSDEFNFRGKYEEKNQDFGFKEKNEEKPQDRLQEFEKYRIKNEDNYRTELRAQDLSPMADDMKEKQTIRQFRSFDNTEIGSRYKLTETNDENLRMENFRSKNFNIESPEEVKREIAGPGIPTGRKVESIRENDAPDSSGLAEWNCAKCMKKVSGASYECTECRLINWDQFYKVKSLQHSRNKPEDPKEDFNKDEAARRLYSFSDKKDEEDWVCAGCSTSNKSLFFLCKGCRKPKTHNEVKKEYRFSS